MKIVAQYEAVAPGLTFSTNGLTLTGDVGAHYRVESSTNLSPSAWSTLLSNVTLAAHSLTITNTSPVSTANRFFRAALIP